MQGVDSRLWDWAIQHIAAVWNMKIHPKTAKHNNGKSCSPNSILSDLSTNPFCQNQDGKMRHLKRFGCLAFFKPWRSPSQTEEWRNKVLLPKRLRGVYLGYSENNLRINSSGSFTRATTEELSNGSTQFMIPFDA